MAEYLVGDRSLCPVCVSSNMSEQRTVLVERGNWVVCNVKGLTADKKGRYLQRVPGLPPYPTKKEAEDNIAADLMRRDGPGWAVVGKALADAFNMGNLPYTVVYWNGNEDPATVE